MEQVEYKVSMTTRLAGGLVSQKSQRASWRCIAGRVLCRKS